MHLSEEPTPEEFGGWDRIEPDADPGYAETQAAAVQSYEQLREKAQRQAQEWQADTELAAGRGASPERNAARERFICQFFNVHLPERTPMEVEAYLDWIDLSWPVTVVNAAGIEIPADQAQYMMRDRYKPKKPEYLIFALRSFSTEKDDDRLGLRN